MAWHPGSEGFDAHVLLLHADQLVVLCVGRQLLGQGGITQGRQLVQLNWERDAGWVFHACSSRVTATLCPNRVCSRSYGQVVLCFCRGS